MANVVCLTSTLADESLVPGMKNYLTGIVNHFEELVDPRISKFFFSRSFYCGGDNHSSQEEPQLIAVELTGYLEGLME